MISCITSSCIVDTTLGHQNFPTCLWFSARSSSLTLDTTGILRHNRYSKLPSYQPLTHLTLSVTQFSFSNNHHSHLFLLSHHHQHSNWTDMFFLTPSAPAPFLDSSLVPAASSVNGTGHSHLSLLVLLGHIVQQTQLVFGGKSPPSASLLKTDKYRV